MADYYNKVKDYLLELEYSIVSEDKEQELFIIEKYESGIVNMFIDCEDPILIFEQYLFEIKGDNADIYKDLLIKN
jgi:hypothetical protein